MHKGGNLVLLNQACKDASGVVACLHIAGMTLYVSQHFALLGVVLEHLWPVPLESGLSMTPNPLTQHRLSQAIPSRIQKI